MANLDSIVALAKDVLVLQDGRSGTDLWLWEHSERVMRVGGMIAALPEVAGRRTDRTVIAVAALFHDAGWAHQVRQGEVDRWQILSRPTNDIQRELGAGILLDKTAELLPEETLERAAETIRQCNDRYTELVEARILAEAENFDDIGVMCMLRQFRQYQAEGRPLEQLLTNWSRQREYHYWEARVNDCLRFETTRQLARERLKGVEQFMSALARDREGMDLHQVLRAAGIEPGRDSS